MSIQALTREELLEELNSLRITLQQNDGNETPDTAVAKALSKIDAVLNRERPPSSPDDFDPPRPMNLRTTTSRRSATIAWDEVLDPTVVGFQILRRDRNNDPVGQFTVIEENTRDTSRTYVDTTVVAGGSYVYRVKSIDRYSNLSEQSGYARADIILDTPASDAISPPGPSPFTYFPPKKQVAPTPPKKQVVPTPPKTVSPPRAPATLRAPRGTVVADAFTQEGEERVIEQAGSTRLYWFGIDRTYRKPRLLCKPIEPAHPNTEGVFAKVWDNGYGSTGESKTWDIIVRRISNYHFFSYRDGATGKFYRVPVDDILSGKVEEPEAVFDPVEWQ